MPLCEETEVGSTPLPRSEQVAVGPPETTRRVRDYSFHPDSGRSLERSKIYSQIVSIDMHPVLDLRTRVLSLIAVTRERAEPLPEDAGLALAERLLEAKTLDAPLALARRMLAASADPRLHDVLRRHSPTWTPPPLPRMPSVLWTHVLSFSSPRRIAACMAVSRSLLMLAAACAGEGARTICGAGRLREFALTFPAQAHRLSRLVFSRPPTTEAGIVHERADSERVQAQALDLLRAGAGADAGVVTGHPLRDLEVHDARLTGRLVASIAAFSHLSSLCLFGAISTRGDCLSRLLGQLPRMVAFDLQGHLEFGNTSEVVACGYHVIGIPARLESLAIRVKYTGKFPIVVVVDLPSKLERLCLPRCGLVVSEAQVFHLVLQTDVARLEHLTDLAVGTCDDDGAKQLAMLPLRTLWLPHTLPNPMGRTQLESLRISTCDSHEAEWTSVSDYLGKCARLRHLHLDYGSDLWSQTAQDRLLNSEIVTRLRTLSVANSIVSECFRIVRDDWFARVQMIRIPTAISPASRHCFLIDIGSAAARNCWYIATSYGFVFVSARIPLRHQHGELEKGAEVRAVAATPLLQEFVDGGRARAAAAAGPRESAPAPVRARCR